MSSNFIYHHHPDRFCLVWYAEWIFLHFHYSITPRRKAVDASKVEYNEHNDPILWLKALPFLEVAASGASRSGENIISNYRGYIFKILSFNNLFLFVSTMHIEHVWPVTRWEEWQRNHRKGNVALVVLGDDTGIVAPSNTSIFLWLDFLSLTFLQLRTRSLNEEVLGKKLCTGALQMPGFFLQSELSPGHPPNHTVTKTKRP